MAGEAALPRAGIRHPLDHAHLSALAPVAQAPRLEVVPVAPEQLQSLPGLAAALDVDDRGLQAVRPKARGAL